MKHYSATILTIRDYNTFKAEFDSAGPKLSKYGFKRTWLNRDVDNPNRLIVVHELEDLPKAREFFRSPEYRQCLAKGGVIGEPQVTLMEELVATPELISV
jgi:uncharacterized protein (DUF1330 family)